MEVEYALNKIINSSNIHTIENCQNLLYFRAKCFQDIKDNRRALQDYLRILKLNSNNSDILKEILLIYKPVIAKYYPIRFQLKEDELKEVKKYCKNVVKYYKAFYMLVENVNEDIELIYEQVLEIESL